MWGFSSLTKSLTQLSTEAFGTISSLVAEIQQAEFEIKSPAVFFTEERTHPSFSLPPSSKAAFRSHVLGLSSPSDS